MILCIYFNLVKKKVNEMKEETFFPLISDEINELVDVLDFKSQWLKPADGIEYEMLIKKLNMHQNFINFIGLSEEDIELINNSIDFRMDNELADEDLEYLSDIKAKFLSEA